MSTDRDAYRAKLACLTEEALLAECKAQQLRLGRLRNPTSGDRWLLLACELECADRGRMAVYYDALALAHADLRALAAANKAAIESLPKHPKETP